MFMLTSMSLAYLSSRPATVLSEDLVEAQRKAAEEAKAVTEVKPAATARNNFV